MFYSDDVGGEYQPGVRKEGAVIFGLERYVPAEVEAIRYLVSPPTDSGLNRLAPEDYAFDLPMQ